MDNHPSPVMGERTRLGDGHGPQGPMAKGFRVEWEDELLIVDAAEKNRRVFDDVVAGFERGSLVHDDPEALTDEEIARYLRGNPAR